MSKKILVLTLISFFVFGLNTFSFAQMKCMGHSCSQHKHNKDNAERTDQEKSVDVGNKICPVLNEKIDEKSKVTYEYEGKVYNFCCASCIDEFKKDPQQYIKKVEEELQAETTQEDKTIPESEMQEGMHEGYYH